MLELFLFVYVIISTYWLVVFANATRGFTYKWDQQPMSYKLMCAAIEVLTAYCWFIFVPIIVLVGIRRKKTIQTAKELC
jgi:hypothetical protein